MKYTPDLEKMLRERYLAGTPAQALADEIGVPVRSVIAKLSSMGIYQRQRYVSKTGEPPIKKDELIERLGTLMNRPPEYLESLSKCNKVVIRELISLLERK